MKDTQKKKITRNYHLLRRVESWNVVAWQRSFAQTGAESKQMREIQVKKKIFLSPEIVKWNSVMLFLLMMMNSASLQELWIWAACISLRTFQRTLRVSGPKLESNAMLGGHWGTGRNTVRKIGKCRNTVSKIDEILILHLFSVTLT